MVAAIFILVFDVGIGHCVGTCHQWLANKLAVLTVDSALRMELAARDTSILILILLKKCLDQRIFEVHLGIVCVCEVPRSRLDLSMKWFCQIGKADVLANGEPLDLLLPIFPLLFHFLSNHLFY